jgi:cellulose synthase/poly-beta-1,6-N-acetylglucosamine synthase-like glycosyltransferase
LLDDFIISMEIAEKGYRVLYEPEAVSSEEGSASLRDEFKRRSRIFCGGFQSVARLPELLNPSYGRLWFQYMSHRVLRWVVTPFLVPLIFVANLALARRSRYYRLTMLAQIVLYAIGFAGLRRLDRTGECPKWMYAPAYFIFIHLAELAGFKRWISQRQTGVWERSKRVTTVTPAADSGSNEPAATEMIASPMSEKLS